MAQRRWYALGPAEEVLAPMQVASSQFALCGDSTRPFGFATKAHESQGVSSASVPLPFRVCGHLARQHPRPRQAKDLRGLRIPARAARPSSVRATTAERDRGRLHLGADRRPPRGWLQRLVDPIHPDAPLTAFLTRCRRQRRLRLEATWSRVVRHHASRVLTPFRPGRTSG